MADPKNLDSLLTEARALSTQIAPGQVENYLNQNPRAILLDVRDSEEYQEGYLPKALHLSRGFLEIKMGSLIADLHTPLLVYCGSGLRSLLAIGTLHSLGYSHLSNLEGGYLNWKNQGFPIQIPPTLTSEQKERYSRHLKIPEVGIQGQLTLLNKKVLIIGMGGLGSPISFYLAAAGVGTLGLLDDDRVELSNLQRQILHNSNRIGEKKIDSALQTLRSFNPSINYIPFPTRLCGENALEIFTPFDLIIDGSDNFQTRYLVNDACILLKKPFIHGSIYRFEGHVSLFEPFLGTGCYRCLYSAPPPVGVAPACAEAGVLGVLPGIIGTIQASEGLKYLLEMGEKLTGKMLVFDAMDCSMNLFKVNPSEGCPYCQGDTLKNGLLDSPRKLADGCH